MVSFSVLVYTPTSIGWCLGILEDPRDTICKFPAFALSRSACTDKKKSSACKGECALTSLAIGDSVKLSIPISSIVRWVRSEVAHIAKPTATRWEIDERKTKKTTRKVLFIAILAPLPYTFCHRKYRFCENCYHRRQNRIRWCRRTIVNKVTYLYSNSPELNSCSDGLVGYDATLTALRPYNSGGHGFDSRSE